ncbi:hypothetical protein Q2941_35975 [Bradyrhizobium sp. UFLA05-153]
MFDAATTTLLRAVFDEVCEDVPRLQTGARTHVASKILEAAAKGETALRLIDAQAFRAEPQALDSALD